MIVTCRRAGSQGFRTRPRRDTSAAMVEPVISRLRLTRLAAMAPSPPFQTPSTFTGAVTVRGGADGADGDNAARAPHDAVASPTKREHGSPYPLTRRVPRPKAVGDSRVASAARARRSNRLVAGRAPLCPVGPAPWSSGGAVRGGGWRRLCLRPQVRAEPRQVGQREQRECQLPVPAVPAPDLVVVQPHLALGQCKALLDAPAGCAAALTIPQSSRWRRMQRLRAMGKTSNEAIDLAPGSEVEGRAPLGHP